MLWRLTMGGRMKSSLVFGVLALTATGCWAAPITKESGTPVPPERIYQPELIAPGPGRNELGLVDPLGRHRRAAFLRDRRRPASGSSQRQYPKDKARLHPSSHGQPP